MSPSRDEILQQTAFLSLFDSPAYIARLPGMDAANRALTETILAQERAALASLSGASLSGGGSAKTSLSNSNLGGWHSGRDLAQWGGEPARAILQAAFTLAGRLTLDRRGRAVNPAWKVECWANVNRRGHANRRHSHPGCFWSGSYYLRVGDETENLEAEKGGAFEFHDPRGVAPALPTVPAALVDPEPGMMVLFPAWMPHSVRPYNGDGIRISIAFNLALAERGGQ